MEQNTKSRAMGYLGTALKLTLGAGVALGGSYLVSRVKEKQDAESSLSRLEQMLGELVDSQEPQPAAPRPGGSTISRKPGSAPK